MNDKDLDQLNQPQERPVVETWWTLQPNPTQNNNGDKKEEDYYSTIGGCLVSPAIPRILPFWLILGGVLFFFCHWITVLGAIFSFPILIAVLLIFRQLLKKNYTEKITCLFGDKGHFLLPILYLLIFLDGFFLIDAGDYGRGHSVVTNLLGDGFYRASEVISGLFLYSAEIVMVLIVFSVITVKIKRKLRDYIDK